MTKSGESPTITANDLIGKTADEIRKFADDNNLVPHSTRPDKWLDPVTGKERLRIDAGHVDAKTGLPYADPGRPFHTTTAMTLMERPRSSIPPMATLIFPQRSHEP